MGRHDYPAILPLRAQNNKDFWRLMSRGNGSRQRGIIAALEAAPAIHLHELGERHTHSERVALQRAANMLQAKAVIGIFRYWDVETQKTRYLLHRPRYDIEAHARAHGFTWMYGEWLKPCLSV
jgi:arginine/lysine/ornithine decarboxylase